jgi:peptide/nickel transport system substrate-binding protein
MRKALKYLAIGATAAFAGALAIVPAVAQDGAGTGGVIIEATFSGDPASFNPIIASDTASRRITNLIFPGFVAADPSQGIIVGSDPENPLTGRALVSDWTVSDDGTIYTFNLREDYTWSDGTPITSADVVYTWNAIQAGTENIVDTPLTFLVDSIVSVEAPDEYTVVVTYTSAECTALSYAGSLYPVPSHVLPADLSALNDDPFNLAPTVSGGPFLFGELRPSELVSLSPNAAYPDASLGFVSPAGFIYKQVPDQTVVVEQFLAGETNVIDNAPVNRRSDIDAAVAAGERQDFRFPGTAWDYLALNVADPNNPQNGADADGNPIAQGNHPLFGDVRVRQAIARAVDVDAMIQAALFGEGDRMTSFIIPASWAYNTDLPLIATDLAAAGALLDEAGFVDHDNDVTTPRIAQGALYAEDGTPLRFTLFSNQGNSRREAVGTLVQDQLAQVGIQVDFQTIEFNTQLEIMDSQTFDAFILGWRNGYPDDPDATQLFTPVGDVVGGGSNDVSFYNARFVELNTMAKSAVDTNGCDPAARSEMYHEMQAIFQEELPYIPLYTIGGHYASDASLSPWTPYGGGENLYWNIDQWAFAAQAAP